MISYRIAETDLMQQIDEWKLPWRARADKATAACRQAGKYVAGSAEGMWSEIKEVFMKLQHDKCCYCERKLASVAFGKIEHDIEHYRPKSRVKNWFTAEVMKELPGWPKKLGRSGAQAKGYYLLPFDPRNYATACKECNSALKSDFFPCESDPALTADSPAAAAVENPWLIFPLGDLDESAESLIHFDGILAQPMHKAAADPRRHWRARVTIRFFQLNIPDPHQTGSPAAEGRENLYRERAKEISDLAVALDSLETANGPKRPRLQAKIKRLIDASDCHASCKRSFLKLWSQAATRQKALEIWDAVEAYLDSGAYQAPT